MKLNKIDEVWNSANLFFKWRFDSLSSRNFATMATWRNDFFLYYAPLFAIELEKLWMTKSQPCVKPACLPSITSNAENNELWNTDRLTSFTSHNCNLFQSSSSLPICASFVFAVLFIHSFHVSISYFLFSLSLVAVSTVWFLLNTFCMTQLL